MQDPSEGSHDARLSEWDFPLPESLIARYPPEVRGTSRLLQLPVAGGPVTHGSFTELPDLLRAGDLLVGNDARVMAGRIGARRASGGRVELLLLEPGPGPVEALARPARRLKEGERLDLDGGGTATLVGRTDDGTVVVELDPDPAVVMARQGSLPLPPYLGREAEAVDDDRYQTVYAGPLGAAAAPTAGLHFTRPLLDRLGAQGVGFATVTLYVGLGTFRPLRGEDLDRGELHPERWEVPASTAQAVASARAAGGRIIAIGTTAVRTLESAAGADRSVTAGSGTTRLFLRPPDRMRVVDGLITNFHLPRSSLLMLVACLVGRKRLLDAYAEAVNRGYRFYSYGDAMLLL